MVGDVSFFIMFALFVCTFLEVWLKHNGGPKMQTPIATYDMMSPNVLANVSRTMFPGRHQSSYSQLIGVSFITSSNARYLGSMKPFSVSVSQDP